MPPRQSELPEGTDHIITGAMERSPAAGGGGGGSGIIRSEADDTGGTATSSGNGSSFTTPFREGAANLRNQATDRVRQFADDGKTRASDTLDELSRIVDEAADSIDERLGDQYGPYARRAAEALSSFATTLREREVDELYDEVRGFVRQSPVVAIGAAAAIGFTLVRLIKAGLPTEDEEGQEGGSSTGGGKAKRSRSRAKS
jgi:ElaB/YqjD/DUF883 family membrane-anchored ribosome-binding protein